MKIEKYKEYKGFKPSYYDKFYCIGKECKNTCCQDWYINILVEEMETWKKEEPELFDEMSKVCSKNQENTEYKINLNKQGFCPFLNEEGLCSIQKKYGYKALSNICKVFPRMNFLHNGMVEMHLSPSCEAVVKQLIKEKDGIKLINYKLKSSEMRITQKETEADRPILYYYYDIKFLLLSILQYREYTIEQRVLILGIAMKKLHEMEKENRLTEIPIFVDVFLENIEKEDFIEKLNRFSCNESIQMLHNVVNIEISFLQAGNYDFERIKNIREKIEKKITPKYEDEQSLFDFKNRLIYQRGNEKYSFREENYSLRKYKEAFNEYKEFIQGREYYIENYLVSWVFFKDFPFSIEGFDIWDEYCCFAVMYSMYRFMLICCLEKNFKDDDFINYTTVFSREILHARRKYVENLLDILKDNKKDNLEYIAIMLLQEEE